MRILSARQAEACVRRLERRGAPGLARVEKPVRRIVGDVRKNGDRALRRYAEKLDGLKPRAPLAVPISAMKPAWESVTEDFRSAVREAVANIRPYCEWQKPQEWRRPSLPGISLRHV